MPLIRHARTVEDDFMRVPDGAEISAQVSVLLQAAQFMTRAGELRGRRVGVLWPNDRNVAELVPHLDQLALVALDFPSFRDGRAYSQARLLRERHGYRGELRAIGDVLSDQLAFMIRAGFDSFELRKDKDVAHFHEAIGRYRDFYQPASDARDPIARLRLKVYRPQGEGIHVPRPGAAALEALLTNAAPHEIVGQAIRAVPRGKLAVVSSFGIESAALLKIVSDVDRSLPVIFLDTGWLFQDTLDYRDALIAHLELSDVRTIRPAQAAIEESDPDYSLWARDSVACCNLRKVAPLAAALAPFDAWITGRKRYEGGHRALLPIVEADGPRLKFNPLARVSPKAVAAIFRTLPRHPLAAAGYTSIGCVPCSSKAREQEGVRGGRWRETGRTECGIHTEALASAATM